MEREQVILVVDDEVDLITIFERTLRRAGYRVLSALNGEEALQVVEQEAGKIDLVISDVVMPKMAGRELAWRLHTQYPQIPMVLLSGYADRDAALEMMDPDQPRFLEKPIDLAELEDVVREILSDGSD
jgi:two-component system, cell cycle sensor histidine kinase and response regulator CckA